MESKTKNRKTRTQIAAMVAKAFGDTSLTDGDDAVCELKEGWFNAAYTVRLADGRDVILKIAPPQDVEVLQYEQNIMHTEVTTMRLVRQNPAIPVPEIYFYDAARDVCDSDYFFMEKLGGENLAHAKDHLDPETLEAIERQVGAIICEINGFPGCYFGFAGNPDLRASSWRSAFIKLFEAVLEDGARKRVAFDDGYDELRATVFRHAGALEEVTTPCLVHWDAWDPNFFVQDGRVVGIIDFERAVWAEPLMEWQFRSLSFGRGVTHSMRGYGKTTFTVPEMQRCYLYTLYLALVLHVDCFYRNYDTDSVFNSSKRMLADSMAWLAAN